MAVEYVLIISSFLILVSIGLSKLSDNFGLPALLIFLAVGMLAGVEGPGKITFNDPSLAQSIGLIALVFILFSGGLSTKWAEVKPVLWQGLSLATFGVIATALLVGVFVSCLLKVSLLQGMLLGSIISSTDAAAVFQILRSRRVSLRGKLAPLLELESGSNDPTAVFLTISIIQLIQNESTLLTSLIPRFILQMGIGGILGIGFAKGITFTLNKLKLAYEGMYPVLFIACSTLIYGSTAILGGNGFLAVYVAGLAIGNSEFVQKKSLIRFFDGLAWLSQISMFVTLGLLVMPSSLIPVSGIGMLISFFLMLVARPLGVFISLISSDFRFNEKLFISWVGLRGAVPIILATFSLLARLPNAEWIFNVVFFIVLTSTLLQGWSIPFIAKLLKVDEPLVVTRRYPIEIVPIEGVDTEMVDLIVPFRSAVAGKSIAEIGMPPDSLIVLISRDDAFIVPSGGTILLEGDTVLVLVTKTNLPEVRSIFAELKND